MNFWLEVSKILIPALISILAIYIARWIEKKKEIEQEIRQKKIQIYSEFTKLIFEDVFVKAAQKQPNNMKRLEAFFPKFRNDLIFWGSDEVVKKYKDFYQEIIKGNLVKSVYIFEDLLFAIRKDVGHKNKNLNEKDLLGIFITDIDEIDKPNYLSQS